jgi:hypothetical protein
MSFDLQKILQGKRALRKNLTARPIAEKLRMLDAMRERELAIRGQDRLLTNEPAALKETPPPFKSKTGEEK